MVSGKRYLLLMLLMAAVLLPLTFALEQILGESSITTVSRQALTDQLAHPATPLYIEVSSRNCFTAECAENHRVVQELANDYRGKIKFLRVYVEDVPDVESILGVHGTPSGVLVTPDHVPIRQGMGGGNSNSYSPVDGFGSRLRLKQLFDSLAP